MSSEPVEVTRVHVEPGPGFVARRGELVAWAEPEPGPRGAAALIALVEVLDQMGERHFGNEEVGRRLAALVDDTRVGGLAGWAVVVPAAGCLVVATHGWGYLPTDRAAAPSEPAVAELPTGTTAVVGRRDVARRVGQAAGDGAEPMVVDLMAGVVPGGAAVVFTRQHAEAGDDPAAEAAQPAAEDAADKVGDQVGPESRPPPPPPPPPPPAAPPVSVSSTSGGGSTAEREGQPLDAEAEVVSLSGPPPEPRPSLPVGDTTPPPEPGPRAGEPTPGTDQGVPIEGVQCARGHLNNPIALYCGSCGISMLQRTNVRVSGSRPPLGVLVFDDGSTFSLNGDYVLGAGPDLAEDVRQGRAHGLRVMDPSRGVEPLHAEIRLLGWDVTVVDRSSRGTYVLPRGATGWQVSPPGRPLALAPGTRVAIGGRTFVFDSNTRA